LQRRQAVVFGVPGKARFISDYLGHKNIKNTARYTRTSARRFEGLWN